MKTWITPAQKVIAALLLAAGFAMLFLPWISVDTDYSIEDEYEDYAERNDMSVREAREEYLSDTEDSYDEYFDGLRDKDIDTDLTGKDVARMLKAEEDNALSPDELGFLVNYRLQTVKLNLSQFAYDEENGGYYDPQTANDVRGYADELTIARVALWIVMIFTAASFLLAMWTLLGGSMRGGIIYDVVVWVILCALAVILVNKMNDPSFMKQLGMFTGEDEPYSITNWPFVGAALAALSCAVTYLNFGKRRPAVGPEAVPAVTHPAAAGRPRFCPNCGSAVSGAGNYCDNCGARIRS